MSDASDTLSRQLTDVTQTDNPPGGLGPDRTTWLERARTGAAVLGFALPLCAYFWLINHYGANLLWHDQWDDINLISHSYSHTLSLSTLWAQHNENRTFFPNLIVLILARTSQFNVLLEEYLGGLMLVFATGSHSGSQAPLTLDSLDLLLPDRLHHVVVRPVSERAVGFSDGLVPRDRGVCSRACSCWTGRSSTGSCWQERSPRRWSEAFPRCRGFSSGLLVWCSSTAGVAQEIWSSAGSCPPRRLGPCISTTSSLVRR